MPCFRGISQNGQIIIVCHVSKPQLSDKNTPPPPDELIAYRALLDTGAQASMFTPKVVREVGLVSVDTGSIIGVSGTIDKCLVYLVDLYITIRGVSKPDKDGRQKISSVGAGFADVEVSLLPERDYGFDVLLGMDVLEQCYFALHGRQFTICV